MLSSRLGLSLLQAKSPLQSYSFLVEGGAFTAPELPGTGGGADAPGTLKGAEPEAPGAGGATGAPGAVGAAEVPGITRLLFGNTSLHAPHFSLAGGFVAPHCGHVMSS